MKVVTMGEMMIRLMPPGHLRIEQASGFEAYWGGDEAIVSASLARFGLPSAYVTRLPENLLGDIAVAKLRGQGVDTSLILRGGPRMGINFYENGASARAPQVIYDRSHSAISEAHANDFDFERIFDGVGWFHVSGITPALSESMAEAVYTALSEARKRNITTSVDLNYRSKLWNPDKARLVMIPMMEHTDILIGSASHTDIMLDIKPDGVSDSSAPLTPERYDSLFAKLRGRFGFKLIAFTQRENISASDNGWSGMLYDGVNTYRSRHYELHLVDRGGGGASFSAGIIFGVGTNMTYRDTVEFAAAASALKQTITGDFNLVSLSEVRHLMDDVSGRVRR
ncbi:MAG: sugar kinase [Oscillospiraceae bacterium]|nr:sugar kinase [Oscillospiraceae bacterium]